MAGPLRPRSFEREGKPLRIALKVETFLPSCMAIEGVPGDLQASPLSLCVTYST